MSVAVPDPAFYAPYKAHFVSYLVKRANELDIQRLDQFKLTPKKHTKHSKKEIEKETKDIEKVITDLGEYHKDASPIKIGIIGAGVSGLYTGLILERLGIDYEILEASDRIGGRVYTHSFSGKDDQEYYDIGAMRFPNTPVMARTFDLFKRMDIGTPKEVEEKAPGKRLIKYYMKGENCPTRYNDITAVAVDNKSTKGTDYFTSYGIGAKAESDNDPFRVSTANGGPVPVSRVSEAAGKEITDDAYDRFRQKIKDAVDAVEQAKIAVENAKTEDEKAKAKGEMEAAQLKMERSFDYLLRHDKFSMRDYLMNVEGYDAETVHWLETTDSASGWFNEAFSENVLESLAFDYNSPSDSKKTETDWYCVLGGTTEVIKAMLAKTPGLESKIKKNHWVTKISLLDDKDTKEDASMKVTYNIKDLTDPEADVVTESTEYSAVINTTTLGALQKIDLTDLAIPYGMKTAIRVLRYDSSSKVGIKFKEMWWRDAKFLPDRAITGGVGKTDMPLRVCVYPSYNISGDTKEDAEKDAKLPGVLLASYTWGQDSERVASHISPKSPEDEKELVRLMMYNLARLHTLNKPEGTYNDRFNYNLEHITSLYDSHHAYDWSKDVHAAGAFALFSPGQFSTLIPYLVRPAADSRFVIIGEHASANHAWIVGALDSAVRGLEQVLTRFEMVDELKQLGDEFGFVQELKAEDVQKQVLLGRADQDLMNKSQIGRQLVPANVNAF